MSLDNAFSREELQAWADRLARQIPADTATCASSRSTAWPSR